MGRTVVTFFANKSMMWHLLGVIVEDILKRGMLKSYPFMPQNLALFANIILVKVFNIKQGYINVSPNP